jgi:hypothetical protein
LRLICATVAVVDAVDMYLSTYPASPIVLDLLGTVDAEEIRAVARRYEPEAEEVFFFRASVGALFGVRRRDGSRAAVKVNKLFNDPAYFEEVQRLQGALATAGFPAPRPVRRVGTVTVDAWLDTGSFRDAHEPGVRTAMATTLARFVEVATATGLRPRREFLRPAGALWPRPHNVLFDFEATAAGAEWIDELARAALDGRDRCGREVVGHTDWSAKHVRFDESLRPTALYDWDSVTVDREPVIVGTAAASFTYTEELGHTVVMWPSLDETLAFVDDYERARGGAFDAAERRAVGAACVYLRGYAARCTHAVGGDARLLALDEFAAALL